MIAQVQALGTGRKRRIDIWTLFNYNLTENKTQCTDWFTYPCLFMQLLLSLALLSTLKLSVKLNTVCWLSDCTAIHMEDMWLIKLRPGRHSSCIVLSDHLNLQNLDLIFSYILMIILLIKYCLKIIIYIEFIGIQL